MSSWYMKFWNGLAQLRIAKHSFAIQYTNGVALRQMPQRNVEWYSVHIYGVVLSEMALRNVE